MHFSTLLAALPLAALAVNALHIDGRRTHSKRFQNRATQYSLKDFHQGTSFFDGFDFFTGADPTNGLVQYVSQDDGKDLAYVQSDNTTVMKVDNTATVAAGGNRRSVRISSKNTYSTGLFIADIYAMPHGCSVWPAYWMVGSDWPNNGEIDIIEGVNQNQFNQYTAHTSDGCTLDKTPDATTKNTTTGAIEAFISSVLGTTCASSQSSNSGCAFKDPSPTSYGHEFNMIAGNVFATLIDDDGVKIWRWERGSIPADIDAKTPDPTSWGVPAAFWSASTCTPADHFKEMSLVFDITVCGGWAGSAFSAAGSGCSGSCSDAVANTSNFDVAAWKINYVAVYQ
ncbi:glycoside hydrolase family 16 protein [Phellopilus nigrolimitatus]|nr:glycoside hydrolase family 16 protein [Phellopilus nigrolimitatus]